MAELWSDIPRIGPDEAIRLNKEARAGRKRSVARFFYYSVWRKIERDPLIPPRAKLRVWKHVAPHLNVEIEVVGPEKDPETDDLTGPRKSNG